MSYELTYNGVRLQVLRVHSYTRTPVYSGPDYLYSKHELTARCLFNPGAVAYRLRPEPAIGAPATPPLVPQEAGNVPGPETDQAVRHALSQPRRKLFWTINDHRLGPQGGADRILLESPLPRPPRLTQARGVNPISTQTPYPTDAANGPFPRVLGVAAVKGTRSLLVDFAVETNVNECDLYTTTPATILSNRWTVAEDLDQDYFATRTIRGHCVFRTDRLLALGLKADDFRVYFANQLAVPPTFKRDRISVVASEDGSSCDYVVIDRERAVNVVASGITRAEILYGNHFRMKSVEDALWNTARAAAGAVRTGLQSTTDIALDPTNLVGGGAAKAGARGVAVGGWDFAASAIGIAFEAIPRLDDTLVVRVWGHRGTTKVQLLNAVNRCLAHFFGGNITILALANVALQGAEYDLNLDESGRYAEFSLRTLRGPLFGALAGFTAAFQSAWNQYGDGKKLPIFGATPSDLLGLGGQEQGIRDAVDGFVKGFTFPLQGINNLTSEEIDGVTSRNRDPNDPASDPLPSLPPPGGRGTRGNYVGSLVTAALQSPCQFLGVQQITASSQDDREGYLEQQKILKK